MKKIGVSLALGVLSLTLSAPAMAQDIELGEIEGEVAIPIYFPILCHPQS